MKNLSRMILQTIQKYPDRLVTNSMTYNNLYKLSVHYSRKLSLLGIHKKPVCINTEKSNDWIAMMLAIWRTGNIVVPLPIHNQNISKHIVEQVKPVYVLQKETPLSHGKDLIFQNTELLNDDDPALILFTSGSTSLPKGVVLSHKNIQSNLDMIHKRYNGHIDYNDKSFSILPWTHCYGLVCELLYLMKHGGQVIIPESKEPKKIFNEMKWKSPTLFFTVPKILEKLYRNDKPMIPSFIKRNYVFGNKLRMMSVGGALCHEHTIRFIQNSYNIPVYQGYGMTECSPMISLNSVEENDIGSVGKLLDGIQTQHSHEGSLMVKGDNVMLGYFKTITEDGLEIQKPKDGWFDTGDNAFFLRDYLHVRGRIGRCYKLSNGLYVDPEYLETILTTSPIIEQVVIFGQGQPHNTVVVYSSKSEDIVAKEIIHLLEKHFVQTYEIPKKLIMLDKPLSGELLTQKLEPNRSLIQQIYMV
jgi:long-subunit acyl-CoA synthetase (AMP-forming)